MNYLSSKGSDAFDRTDSNHPVSRVQLLLHFKASVHLRQKSTKIVFCYYPNLRRSDADSSEVQDEETVYFLQVSYHFKRQNLVKLLLLLLQRKKTMMTLSVMKSWQMLQWSDHYNL